MKQVHTLPGFKYYFSVMNFPNLFIFSFISIVNCIYNFNNF
jgi:hypothetical protein